MSVYLFVANAVPKFGFARLCHNPNLIHKKYVNFTTRSAVCNVSQSKSQSTASVDINGDVAKLLPDKPSIIPQWRPTPSTDRTNLLQHYLKLSKIRLTTLVVVTSMAGYAMAPAPFELSSFLLCIAGTGLLSGAANAVNQFHEVPFDAQMSRTKHRVIVCGRLTPLHSMMFAAGASATGLSLLYFGVNGLTASLGLANLVLYTMIYTPMKRISILNTWVGSIVGAIPPLMGWAACADHLGPGAWLMAALLYSWQFPHFNALSWNLRPDYSRAGYRMMAVTHPALCRRVALRHTGALLALSAAAPILGVTTIWFAALSAPLNAYFVLLAYRFYRESNSATSRQLFRYSLIHLPALMLMFLLTKRQWYEKDEEADAMAVDDDEGSAVDEGHEVKEPMPQELRRNADDLL